MADREAAVDHNVNSQLLELVALGQHGEAAAIAVHGKPVVNPTPIGLQPVFELGKDQCPPVPWSAFAPMSDDEAAEWGV